MNLNRKPAVVVAVLALVVMFVGIASAQTAVVTRNATFTLPFRANWAGTVLSPGNYTLTVTEISDSGAYRIDFAGSGKKHVIVAMASSGLAVSKQSMLVGENGAGAFAIRALHLPKANLVLTFPTSKAREPELAKTNELVAVPVQIAQK